MGIFSIFFKQLTAIKEEKNKNFLLFGSKKKKSNSNSSDNISTVVTSAPTEMTTSSKQSSKEGTDYKYNEAGRRYHGNAESKYVLPNDDDEKDRLHEQHWILRYALQRNYFAPVTKMLEEGITVLDSGCGPVFAEQIKPANVELAIGNITKEIPFPDNSFDYIHQRLLIVALTGDNWESALKNFYRVLKPGGYIELAELDVQNYVNKGPMFTEIQRLFSAMFVACGFPEDLCKQLEGRLIKAGFVNIVVQVTPLPINHGGKVGELWWKDGRHAYANIRPILAKTKTEWEDVEVFERDMDACSAEAIEYKVAIDWYALYAQKPLS